jgi:hypothetical protein
MQMILDLQKLEVEADAWFGNSCTSSLYTCCNGNTERGYLNGD